MIKDYIIKSYANGRLSIGKAAEILDVSIYDIHKISNKKGIKSTATKEQIQKSKELLNKLFKKVS